MIDIKNATIAEGIEDVALLLGLNPSETIFIHSTNVPPNDGTERLIGHPSPFDHSQPLCYLPRTKKENTAKAIILFNNKDLLSYFDEVGLAPSSNYYNIDNIPSDFTLTNLSVQSNLLNRSNSNADKILYQIKNKTIVSSYLSDNDTSLASQTNGRLLMKPEHQIPFNSKNKMREFANKYEFKIPLGVEINSAENFDEKIIELKEIIYKNEIDIATVKLWCKLEAQSSGSGTVQLNGLSNTEIERLKKSIIDYAESCNLYTDEKSEKTIYNMSHFTSLVIEVDVECIQGNKVVSNIGVEAVISDNAINIIGSVRQITNSGQYSGAFGRYLGSKVDEETIRYKNYAEEAALPVFKYFWNEGYRGFVTIDVLVVQNDNKIFGYNIDPNARFSGGTMLLSILQYASKMTNKPFYGLTYFVVVPKNEKVFNSISEFAGSNLYAGAKSNYKGIIPFIINDFIGTKKCNAQIAAISDDINELEEMWKQFNHNRKTAVDNIV
jgi:hypothetical protein